MATLDAILRIAAQTSGVGEVRALQGALGGLSKTAATVRTALAGLTGVGAILGAGLSVAGLAAASKGIVDMADSLDELSQRTGTSVETLSKLGLAARQSGLDTEQVSASMVKLSKGLGEIAAGGGEKAAAALSTLGISAKDAQGQLKTADQVLLEVSDRFQAMPDGVTKAKLAMDLFGKSGAALIPMLNMGSDAIERLNTGISADFAKNAGIYNDQLANLQAQASALGVAVLTDLLPSLIEVTKFTATAIQRISEWYSANKGTITGITSALAGASKWTMLLGVGLTGGAGAAIELYKQMEATEKKTAASAGAAAAYTTSLGGATLNAEELLEKLREQQDKEDAIKQAKKEQLELQKAQKQVYDGLMAQLAAVYQRETALSVIYSKRAEDRGKAAQDQLSIEEAQIGVAKAYLDNRLALATSDQERRKITLEIIELDKKAAAAQYQATLAQIQVEKDLSNLRTLEAERKLRQSLEELRIAEALGVVTAEIQAKAQSARSALMSAAVENAGIEKSLAARTQVAALNYQAAQIGLQGRTQQAGGPGPSPQIRNYVNVGGMKIPQYADTVDTGPTTTDKPRSYVTIAGMRIPQYAQGGFVTRRTLAEIGEGGEPEYVVPQSKAKRFANNILGGVTGSKALSAASSGQDYGYAMDKRGNKWSLDPAAYRGKTLRFGAGDSSTGIGSPRWQLSMARMSTGTAGMRISAQRPQVIIQTGPVQRRNDGDYVTLSDLEQTVASSVDQTMALFQKTAKQPSFRRRTGSR